MPDLQRLTQYARAMRREMTPAERLLWRYLRGGGLEGLKFRRQVPLGDYIADFACFSPRVIVECDGGQHADNNHDAIRNSWFQAQGFQVIRLWNSGVLDNPDGTVEWLLATLRRGL